MIAWIHYKGSSIMIGEGDMIDTSHDQGGGAFTDLTRVLVMFCNIMCEESQLEHRQMLLVKFQIRL